MRLAAALLASLVFHLVLILGPEWREPPAPPAPPAGIEVRLAPPEEAADAVAEDLATDVRPPAAAARSADPPRELRGDSLRRAQAALTRHLFYPPEAVARGLEGDVILLLVLDADGRIARVDVARSSGHAVLDDAAVDAASRIGRLSGIRRQTLFPVSFRLN